MFKKGSLYSRKNVGEICFPGRGRPSGGVWDTGYVRVRNNLIIFMNINVAGRTGHNFDNRYDGKNQTIVWFGKPKSNSKQPTFKRLINGELTPHFFARWDNTNPDFTYLGIGKIVSVEDGTPTEDSKGNPAETIKIVLTCQDADEIISNNESKEEITHSFTLEKYLEEFIVDNWNNTEFGKTYDIYEQDGKVVGKQYQTGIGPCDILAISKDKKEFLIIELKKGRASDQVIGQLTRYMGSIKSRLAVNGEIVKGCIIALDDDPNLKCALSVIPYVEFYKYRINFSLLKS